MRGRCPHREAVDRSRSARRCRRGGRGARRGAGSAASHLFRFDHAVGRTRRSQPGRRNAPGPGRQRRPTLLPSGGRRRPGVRAGGVRDAAVCGADEATSRSRSLLVAAGAHEDVFTSALLGDVAALSRMLAADPTLAQATDPAVTSSTSHPSSTRSRAGSSRHCDFSSTTSDHRFLVEFGRCAVPPRRAAWRWSNCCSAMGRTRHASASDGESCIPGSLRYSPAAARRLTPPARGSVQAARETRVARTIRTTSAPSCDTVPAPTTAGRVTPAVRAVSMHSTRPLCTTPPRLAS